MERDMANLLEHLDELIAENKRTLVGFYVRGDRSSRERRGDATSLRLQ